MNTQQYSQNQSISRLKSYIEGNLKFNDIMHPSKINANELRTRAYVAQYLNSRYYDTIYSDIDLKRYSRRAQSKLTSYISGDTPAQRLIHPSKYTELSQEALKLKIEKQRILRARRNDEQSRLKPTAVVDKDWISLGQQLNEKRSPSEVDHPTEPEPTKSDVQIVAPPETTSNTVVFNGNVNILCVNTTGDRQFLDTKTRLIFEGVKRQIEDMNQLFIPSLEEKSDDESRLEIREIRALDDAEKPAIEPAPNSDVNESLEMVNQLLPTVQKLKAQYRHLLTDWRELMLDRRILLKHQEISDQTITLLSEETTDLKRKNEYLIRHSERVIGKLHEDMKKLRQMNRLLIEKLHEKLTAEKVLQKRNNSLTAELKMKSNETEALKISSEQSKIQLRHKIENIEKCFDSIIDCIHRTEDEVTRLQSTTNDTSDKRELMHTIRKLDEQNNTLMGKVKHMPEKIRSILNHVSCTMSTLEEQNTRLLRTLQNSERVC